MILAHAQADDRQWSLATLVMLGSVLLLLGYFTAL
jgi:hypothetical protein